jgi:hypothetical protein
MQRTLALDTDAALVAGSKKGAGVKRPDDDRRSTDDLEDPGGEILGDLQWVARLHSRLDVPRTFSLVPMPPSVDAARNAENQRMKLLKETDADHGWIRMLSTARGRKSEAVVRHKRASPGSGGLRRTASARSAESSNSPTASIVASSDKTIRRQNSRSPKSSRPQSQGGGRTTTFPEEPISPKKKSNSTR